MSEPVIASRTATARLLEAGMVLEPAAAATMCRRGSVEGVFDWFRGFSGAPWVGGRVTLTRRRLHFAADPLNRMVHVDPMEVDVELREVIDVAVRQGLAAGTVQVLLPGAALELRCLGARAFADDVRAAVADCR